jgi:signal transduction histidine kinase/CheY-like chemotaxis protein
MVRSQTLLLKLIRAMLVASIVVPAGVLALFAWHSYNQTVQGAQERAHRLAAVVQEHTLKVFETIGLVLQTADQKLRGVDRETLVNSKPLWDELHKLEQSSEQVASIFVVDRDGFGPFTTRIFQSPVYDFSDRDYYYAQRRANQGLYVGQSYMGKISKDHIFNFSIRRTSADGRFDGVVGVSAYVKYFENYYRSIGMEEDHFAIALVKDDGNILVRYPSIAASYSKIGSDSPFLRTLRASDRGTFFARSPFNGQDRLYGYVKVRGFPVYAVYGIDQRTITATWLATFYQAAALAFAVGLCLFATAWVALKRAKQEGLALENLTQTTRKLEQEIEKRERAEASLMQTQRLEAVGQLTGGIAHDFNNLLTVIAGNLDLADRRNDLGSIRRMLKSIRYASDRAANLTRQLLAFSRRHMLNPKAVDLNGVLARTRVLIEHCVPENITLDFDLSADLCPVRVDVSEFEAAVLNLVVNARDAMPDGGTLKIATRNMTFADGDANAPQGRPGRYIALRIEDTGYGMAPETLARVYEPFFTTKEVGKGTGLGLSQVYGFAKQSGGSVSIESTAGRGTQVSIFLPWSSEAIAEDGNPLAAMPKLERPVTILVVEDDAEVRKTSVAMLQDLGHQILIARNAAEALALVKEASAPIRASDPIDILFTDVVMPGGMSGIELANQAATVSPALEVLITTGYPGHVELLRNEFAVLPKPFTRVDLELLIRSLVDRRDQKNQEENRLDSGSAPVLNEGRMP